MESHNDAHYNAGHNSIAIIQFTRINPLETAKESLQGRTKSNSERSKQKILSFHFQLICRYRIWRQNHYN